MKAGFIKLGLVCGCMSLPANGRRLRGWRSLQGDDDKSCDEGDPIEFCQDRGGNGAWPSDEDECLDNFVEDCYCIDGYTMNVAARTCEEDIDDGCNMDNPHDWCQDEGGSGAYAISGRSCYDSFEDDCDCYFGFRKTDDECEECDDDNNDAWCEDEGGSGAYAISGGYCPDSFEDHCGCSDGYIKTDNGCEECNNDNPDAWCQSEGGSGAYARNDVECYDSFEDHCLCYSGYEQTDGACMPCPSPNMTSNELQYFGNNGQPSCAFPLLRCMGDCDTDDDCAGGLVCYQRDGSDEVPGCIGGADDDDGTDYCVDAAQFTQVPSESPSLAPSVALTASPSSMPSLSPSASPSSLPSLSPSASPSSLPSLIPSASPSSLPSQQTELPPPIVSRDQPAIDWGALLQNISKDDLDAPIATITFATIYRGTYVGRFQKVTVSSCSFPSPMVVAGCSGGQILHTGSSDPSISCVYNTSFADGNARILCNTTCAHGGCNESFFGASLLRDFGNSSMFGEIYFQCLGSDVNDVSGWFGTEGEVSGTCSDNNEDLRESSQAYQLGVWCSDLNAYSFDDALFECNWEATSISIDGAYSCYSDKACFDYQSCSFTIPRSMVTADVHRFSEDCIASTGGSHIPSITSPPNSILNARETKALFQVNVGFFYNDEACTGRIEMLRTICTDGSIELIINQSTMLCSVAGNAAIECNETSDMSPRNTYTNVLLYECTGTNQAPHTEVEISSAAIDCASAFDEAVSLELQLSAVCDGLLIYDDFLYECDHNSSFISRTPAFTCGIPELVLANNDGWKQLPTVRVGTDYRWGVFGPDICLNVISLSKSSAEQAATKRLGPGPIRAPDLAEP